MSFSRLLGCLSLLELGGGQGAGRALCSVTLAPSADAWDLLQGLLQSLNGARDAWGAEQNYLQVLPQRLCKAWVGRGCRQIRGKLGEGQALTLRPQHWYRA